MKVISILLIIAGTIGASVTAAHIPPLWLEFIIFLFITGAGIYLKRKNLSGINNAQNESVDPLNQFKTLIDEQVKFLAALIEKDNVPQGLIANGQIEHLYNQVEQIRINLINQLGMKKYIALISPFARAERELYRGYSAAIDGYDDEATQSISQSLEFFKMTKEEMNRLMER